MTKDDVKRSNLSPDGLMQMILQLAHHRAHGFTPSTYESASTAGFKHGRTETIRSATPEAAEFCAVMDRAEAPATDKFAALKCVRATESDGATSAACFASVVNQCCSDSVMLVVMSWCAGRRRSDTPRPRATV